MRKPWEADIHLTEERAARLIARQFPDLAPARLTPLGAGWDNAAFLVNGRFVFRFPRRRVAVTLLEREVRILPRLAPQLPLPIPVPEYVGAPTPDYPFVFAGYALLPGRTACQCACSASERVALAPALARFLAALHGLPIGAEPPGGASDAASGRAAMPGQAPQLKRRLVANAAGLGASDIRAVIALVDELSATPVGVPRPCWVHGDLYACHLLLDGANRLAGVIDWGDVKVGDPVRDLSIAFSFLPPAARPEFRRAYGAIDEATWRWARLRAIHYGAILAEYGTAIADPSLKAVGEDALRCALIDL